MTLFVLTGAPGVGKSAILERLASDVSVVPEPAREVLAEERARDGDAVPERDPAAFVARLLDRSIEKHRAANGDGVTLFDRGVPDCIAYAAVMHVDPGRCIEAADRYRYHADVLVLEPWREIYTTDEERRMSFDATIAFHDAIVDAYRVTGYSLTPVPRGAIDAREAFVRDFIRGRER